MFSPGLFIPPQKAFGFLGGFLVPPKNDFPGGFLVPQKEAFGFPEGFLFPPKEIFESMNEPTPNSPRMKDIYAEHYPKKDWSLESAFRSATDHGAFPAKIEDRGTYWYMNYEPRSHFHHLNKRKIDNWDKEIILVEGYRKKDAPTAKR